MRRRTLLLLGGLAMTVALLASPAGAGHLVPGVDFTYSVAPTTPGATTTSTTTFLSGPGALLPSSITFHLAAKGKNRHVVAHADGSTLAPPPTDGPIPNLFPAPPGIDPDADVVGTIVAVGDFVLDGCAPIDPSTPDIIPIPLFWNGGPGSDTPVLPGADVAQLELPTSVGPFYVDVTLAGGEPGKNGIHATHYDLTTTAPIAALVCPGSTLSLTVTIFAVSAPNPSGLGGPGGGSVQANPAKGGYKSCVSYADGVPTTHSACVKYSIP